jgi:hypothetical protein
MDGEPIFLKSSAPHLSNEPILSARSISLDSTFKAVSSSGSSLHLLRSISGLKELNRAIMLVEEDDKETLGWIAANRYRFY